jgi:hypothetical protein
MPEKMIIHERRYTIRLRSKSRWARLPANAAAVT